MVKEYLVEAINTVSLILFGIYIFISRTVLLLMAGGIIIAVIITSIQFIIKVLNDLIYYLKKIKKI